VPSSAHCAAATIAAPLLGMASAYVHAAWTEDTTSMGDGSQRETTDLWCTHSCLDRDRSPWSSVFHGKRKGYDELEKDWTDLSKPYNLGKHRAYPPHPLAFSWSGGKIPRIVQSAALAG
jgi:hypothetical protein